MGQWRPLVCIFLGQILTTADVQRAEVQTFV